MPRTHRTYGSDAYALKNINLIDVTHINSQQVFGNPAEMAIFVPNIMSYNDYYPFGMLMPNRHQSSDGYRYGFQGQELDNEVKGTGNSLNYKYRMHDPRLGRFFAIDPLTAKYPWYSPYQFSGNKVIQFVELEGLEEGPIYDQIIDWHTATVRAGDNAPDEKIVELYNNIHFAKTNFRISREDLHKALDAAGFVPVVGEIADLTNAVIYLAEGDYTNAGISAIAIIPIVGDTGKIGKYTVKYGDEALALLKSTEKGKSVLKRFELYDKIRKGASSKLKQI